MPLLLFSKKNILTRSEMAVEIKIIWYHALQNGHSNFHFLDKELRPLGLFCIRKSKRNQDASQSSVTAFAILTNCNTSSRALKLYNKP